MCGIRGYKTREKVPCTMLLNYLHTFLLKFSRFLILVIYIIHIRYWQVLFTTQEQLGKSQSATSTFKCGGSTAAVPVSNAAYIVHSQLVEIVVERSIFECSIQKSIPRTLQLKKYYVIFKNQTLFQNSRKVSDMCKKGILLWQNKLI